MMAFLLDPGSYNFSYNQAYLLCKLKTIDVMNFYFIWFWLSVFFVIGIIYFYFSKIRTKIIFDIELENKHRQEIASRFDMLCKAISEDEFIFKRPEHYIQQIYFHEMRYLVEIMEKDIIYYKKNYPFMMPDFYNYQKKVKKD